MKYNWIKIVPLASLFLFLAGCSQAGTAVSPEETQPQPTPNLTAMNPPVVATQTEPETDGAQMTEPAQASPSPGIEFLVEMAKQDLARQLSIPESQIALVEAKAVVWPDSSLGCPQPGMAYKQVPEDGALIVLQAQGSVYEYHNGGTRGLFLCEKVYKDPNTPPKLDITDLTPSPPDKNNPPPLTPDNSIPPGEDQ